MTAPLFYVDSVPGSGRVGSRVLTPAMLLAPCVCRPVNRCSWATARERWRTVLSPPLIGEEVWNSKCSGLVMTPNPVR